MYGNIGLKAFVSSMIVNVNKYTTQSFSTEDFLIDRVNKGLAKLFRYRKRYFNTTTELFEFDEDTTSFDLSVMAKNIEFIYDDNNDWSATYAQFSNFNNTDKQVNQYKKSGKNILLSNPTRKIYVQYEKWFNLFSKTDYDDNTELPIPFWYNDILESICLSMITPIRLGEGAGNLINIYKADYRDEIAAQAKQDSYDVPVKGMQSHLYGVNGAI